MPRDVGIRKNGRSDISSPCLPVLLQSTHIYVGRPHIFLVRRGSESRSAGVGNLLLGAAEHSENAAAQGSVRVGMSTIIMTWFSLVLIDKLSEIVVVWLLQLMGRDMLRYGTC